MNKRSTKILFLIIAIALILVVPFLILKNNSQTHREVDYNQNLNIETMKENNQLPLIKNERAREVFNSKIGHLPLNKRPVYFYKR